MRGALPPLCRTSSMRGAQLIAVTTLQFSGAFAKWRKATINPAMHVRPPVYPSAWNNSAPTGQVFVKFDI